MKSKSICFLIFLVFMSGPNFAGDNNIFISLKDQLDTYDKTIRNRDLGENDVAKWWQINDKFILSLFNEVMPNKSPLDYFAKGQLNLPKGMKANYNYNSGEGTLISDKHCCGENCTPHELYIYIYPLNRANTIFYIDYSKTWWNPPDCEGDRTGAGTFYILEKNRSSGLYEIVSRFEESNFYREMVQTGKLNSMVQIKRNNYGWSGALETEYDPITEANGEIRFNTKLKVCDPGGPCYHKMYLYWVYDRYKKLRCLYYLDRYELINDPETGKLKPVGPKVELAP